MAGDDVGLSKWGAASPWIGISIWVQGFLLKPDGRQHGALYPVLVVVFWYDL